MSRRRRSSGSAPSVATSFASKANVDSTQTILDIIALGNTNAPALDTYWMMYMKHPWVAACVDLIANAVSGDGFDIVAKKNMDAADISNDSRVATIEEFFDIAFVDKQTMRRAMYSLSVDIKVFGLGYWRKKRAGRLCVGLERYDPRFVLPKPSADRRSIDSFIIRQAAGNLTDSQGNNISMPDYTNAVETIDPADMIFFTLGGGDQLLGAPSPVEKLDSTLGVDLAVRKFRQSFFNNGAINGNIFVAKQANREQLLATKAQIDAESRGVANAFRSLVLAGEWEIQGKGNTAGTQDFDFVKASGINREEVCAVYGVPVGKLTYNANALGSAGKDVDDQTFQEQCVLPLEESIFEILTRDLLVNEFEIDDLELAPKRRASLRFDMFGAANQGVQVGMTGNEARQLVGLAPILNNPLMEEPLFMQTRGPSMTGDMPIDPASLAPSTDGTGSDNVDESNASINQSNADEAGKSAKGKSLRRSWY